MGGGGGGVGGGVSEGLRHQLRMIQFTSTGWTLLLYFFIFILSNPLVLQYSGYKAFEILRT